MWLVALLAMALSLLSPWLALIVMAAGAAVSYTQACAMLGLITARPDEQLVSAKLALTVVSLIVTLVTCGGVCGLLMSGVVQHVLRLLSSVGSLI